MIIVKAKKHRDSKISFIGAPYTTRPIITTGEVKGMIENQNERGLSGL